MESARAATILLGPLVACGLFLAVTQADQKPAFNVFEQPAIQQQVARQQAEMISLALQKKLELSIVAAKRVLSLTPESPTAHYNLGCLLALSGKSKEALTSLRESVRRGFRNTRHLENDPDLVSLKSDPEFAAIVEQCRQPFVPPSDSPASPAIPEPIRNGVALVSRNNTRWNEATGTLVSIFEPVRPSEREPQETLADAEAARLTPAELAVRRWVRDGSAAGHSGDLYDNRDRDHSNLDVRRFPELVRVEYGPDAQKVQADWGVQIHQMYDRPTLGNSSTSHVGTPFWRSNPRVIQGDDRTAKLVYNQYVHNMLYVYPEHNDFDPEHGDVYPANIPFCVVSQGSSGSDQPFLEALTLTMGAFSPETKQKLVSRGVLMPTVQAIFRRCLRSVQSDEDYRSGKAHPMVFQDSELDPLRMVETAQALPADWVPPIVQLKATEEDPGVPGRDYFYPAPGEKLFDTPVAIARLYRSVAATRRMVIDASGSQDLNGRPLTFHWVVLQGDPKRVTIRPLNDQKSKAEIIFQWHEKWPVASQPGILSNRVDVGVFVSNGRYTSAPGFVSSFSLANEKRTYDEQGRIQAVDYGDPVQSKNYVDPAFDLRKSWKDQYHWSDGGELFGWTRFVPGVPDAMEFNHDGTLVLRRDDLGRAAEAKVVRYVPKISTGLPGTLEQQFSDQTVTYVYADANDRRGRAELNSRQPVTQ